MIIGDKKGMTLVELILGIIILGFCGTMLVSAFTTSTNIINRATLYKNMSSSTLSSVELEEVQDSLTPDTFSVTGNREDNQTITFTYKKGAEAEVTKDVHGRFYAAASDSSIKNAHVHYKEFIANSFEYVS